MRLQQIGKGIGTQRAHVPVDIRQIHDPERIAQIRFVRTELQHRVRVTEDRIERVANVSNYEIYTERIREMIKRKEDAL